MAVETYDLDWRLSGGADNLAVGAALGGAISQAEIVGGTVGALFDDVTAAEATAGDIEYRCLYIFNRNETDSLTSTVVWIEDQTSAAGSSLDIGLDPAGVGDGVATGVATTIANESAAPAGVVFSAPATSGTGLSIGTLGPGEGIAIWLRRTVTAGAAGDSYDRCELRVSGDNGAAAPPGGPTPGFDTLTIASGTIGSNLTAFPVFVDLATLTSDFWDNVAIDGGDIRITNVAETISYPVDVPFFFHAGQKGHLFFKADLLSGSDNVFRIQYGTGAAALAVTDPLGRNAVWSAFNRVFDFRENVDRTGSGGALTMFGGANATAGNLNLDGSSDGAYMGMGAPTALTAFVVGQMDATSGNKAIFSYADSYQSGPWRATMFVSSAGFWSIYNNTNGTTASAVAAGLPADFTAAYVHTNGGTRAGYVNGALAVSAGASANLDVSPTPTLQIGFEDSSYNEAMSGKIAFVAVALTAMSADAIEALHENRRNAGAFYTIT